MRKHKKMARYVEKNGYEIEDYNTICEILGEKPTSGEAKEIQLNRWRLYFDFEKERNKHKFTVKEIYDDKNVKENEEVYAEMRKIIANSKYRRNLLQVILYLLVLHKNLIVTGKTSFAVKCGFLNQNAARCYDYEKYMKFRKIMKKNNPDKNYFKVTMTKSSFYELMNGIKQNSKNVIEGLLIKMREEGLIAFDEHLFGYNEHVWKVLSDKETEIYNECEREAINQVSKFYNLKQKRKKSKIELQDFIYEPKIANKYDEIVKDLAFERLGYTKVYKRYVIWGVALEQIKKIRTIKTEDEYKEAISKINKISLNSMKDKSDKKIKEKEIEKMQFDKLENDIEKEYEYDNDEKAYYNRLELLDLLVNTEAPIDAIDIESYISDEEAKMLLIEAQLINELKIQEDKSVNT